MSIRQRLRASAVQLLRGLGDLAALVAGPLQLVCGGLARAITARNRRGAVSKASRRPNGRMPTLAELGDMR